MGPGFFGDSYDIIKREIIHGLAPPEHWVVHPMYFVEEPDLQFVDKYTEFLGINIAQGEIFRRRRRFREIGRGCCKHLFLDPDIGIKLDNTWSYKRVAGEDLVQIATAPNRLHRLTLVFDQSYTNTTLETRIGLVQDKLTWLQGYGVYGAAYVSHAVFMWVSAREHIAGAATNRLINCSRLPHWRFVGNGV